jgi:hypothetical protein
MAIITLIPAYKKDFIEDVLECLSAQTVKPDKIYLSDDSPENLITTLVDELLKDKFHNIRERLTFVNGPKKGAHANISSMINQFIVNEEDYFHIFLDDDLISNTFYEMHLRALQNTNAYLSINKRHFVNFKREILALNQYPSLITKLNLEFINLGKNFLYKSTVPKTLNWVGEYTNLVYSAKTKNILLTQSFDDGLIFYGLGDIGSVLNIIEKFDVVFINNTLSAFRQSEVQGTSNITSPSHQAGIWAWAEIALHAFNYKYISNLEFQNSLKNTLYRYKLIHLTTNNSFLNIVEDLILNKPNSKFKFNATWISFLESFPDGKSALKFRSQIFRF